VLWHGPGRIVLVFDDEDRRDQAFFHLAYSRQYLILKRLAETVTPMDQLNFVRMLRIELNVEQVLIAPFRRLDWRSSEAASGVVERGTDRMGRSIAAECDGVDRLPDELLISLPVYVTPGVDWRVSVRCMLEVDAMAQRMILRPLPGELETAEAIIHQRIGEALRQAEGIPVYYGSP